MAEDGQRDGGWMDRKQMGWMGRRKVGWMGRRRLRQVHGSALRLSALLVQTV